MSDIDERVVEMKFDNAQFESGTKETLSTLEKLKKGLNLDGATKGLDALQDTANGFSLSDIADNVDDIAGKFSALGIAGVAALATIASQAVSAGINLTKSLTIDPIKSGLDEYNTNLNSIQTVLSNTQSSGANLNDVNKALNELNTYSDQTIYNFSEMARNVGTFTAAGVGLKTATASIKGIANLAALSGSNSQQASTAMYQLSQAISSGKVGLQDWNSVVNAGMGGSVFQRALAQTAVQMGTLKDSALKLDGPMKNVKISGESFRNSISAKDGKPSWLSSEVLTTTLKHFTGDMTDAQLKTEGFTKAQVKSIQLQAKTAKDAATVVKTLPQLIGTLQESAQSGWSQSFSYIFGDFEQAKVLFTGVNNVIGGMVSSSAKARNKVLGDWEKNGGRTMAITAIVTAFHSLMDVLAPIRKAFTEIFPPVTGQMLITLTQNILEFANSLKVSGTMASQIGRSFKGVFALLDIGRMIIVQVVKTLFGLVGGLGEGGAGFLDITANIGDFLVSLRNAIKNGDGLAKVFEVIGAVLKVPISIITSLVSLLGGLASGIGAVTFGPLAAGAEKLSPLQKVLETLGAVADKVKERFSGLTTGIGPVISAVGNFIGEVATKITEGVNNINWDTALTAVQTGFFGALTVLVSKFIKGGGKGAGGFKFDIGGDGLFGSIKESFEAVTGQLETMQKNLKSKTLLNIAIAVGILTVAMVALAMIDSQRLTAASVAMGIMFAELAGSMKAMDIIAGGENISKIPAMAAGLILLSIAVTILASAVAKLGGLDWGELTRGLTGLTVILAELVLVSKFLEPAAPGLVKTGLAMIPFAVGIRIMGDAISSMAELDWNELSRGLVSFAATLGGLILFQKASAAMKGGFKSALGLLAMSVAIRIMASSLHALDGLDPVGVAASLLGMGAAVVGLSYALRLMPEQVALKAAASLIVMAIAVKTMAGALAVMGAMSVGDVGKALLLLGGSLIILTATLIAMGDPIVLLGAAALIVAAGALLMLAPALAAMGAMDMDTIGKALGVLAASLAILALSLTAMIFALPGAAALLVASAALLILGPALAVIGAIPLAAIGTALLALVGVFVVLGVGALALAAVVPILILLGAAILLLGAGVGLAGAGVLAFSIGLTALGAAGAAGIGILILAINQLLDAVPDMADKFTTAIVSMADAIGNGAPQMVNAMVKIITAMLNAVGTVIPKIVQTGVKIIQAFLGAIGTLIPQVVNTGLRIINGVLAGIAKNIGGITTNAIKIVVNFINAIADRLPSIIQSGVNLILKFINGLSTAIEKNSTKMGEAGGRLAVAIIQGMAKGISAGMGEVIRAATGIAGAALEAVKHLLGIHSPSKEFEKIGIFVNEGFIKGLLGNKDDVAGAYKGMQDMLHDAIEDTKKDIDDYQEKIADLTQTRKDDTKAVAEQRAALQKAKDDNKSGIDVTEEKEKLDDLTKARNKDTRELKDARKALKDAKKDKPVKGKTAKDKAESKANNEKKQAKDVKAAQDRIEDLTNARVKDQRAVAEQQKVLAQARKDRKDKTEISEEQDKLDKLLRTQKKNNTEYQETSDSLAQAQADAPRLAAAQQELNDKYAGQEQILEDLAQKNEDYDDKIKDQTKTLEDAIKTRDDYNKSLTDQFSALSDISEDTSVDDYFAKLEGQVTKVNEFSQEIQELRNRGLNDTGYQKLLSEGTDALPFIDQLLQQGQDGVSKFNSLTTQLGTAAGGIGSAASQSMYQAGVDTAQGLLDGLKAKQTDIQAQMTTIANAMVQTIKDQLGIHSPSREFSKIGAYSNAGLVQGLKSTSGTVEKAAGAVGDNALSALKDSISNIASTTLGIDMTPVIRPVLDLTSVQRDAGLVGTMLGKQGIAVDSAYSSAAYAANGYDANQAQMMAYKDQVATAGNTTTFIQNNNSPKALSNAELYRQTNNLISRAKEG